MSLEQNPEQFLRKEVVRHEAGHALVALLVDAQLIGYEPPKVSYQRIDLTTETFSKRGAVGYEISEDDLEGKFRIAIAGPAAETDFVPMHTQKMFADSDNTDFDRAQRSLRKLAEKRNILPQETIEQYTIRSQKKLFELFRRNSIFRRGLAVVGSALSPIKEPQSKSIHAHVLSALEASGIHQEARGNMLATLEAHIDPVSLLSEKLFSRREWLGLA